LQRYFITEGNWEGDTVTIKGEDVHHISRVMRMQPGDEIICNHPDGSHAICEISRIEKDDVLARVEKMLESSSELPVDVTIAQGLAKGDKLDTILQKGTELGAKAFIPMQMDRSIVVWDEKKQRKKLERFEKIVKEASEQSHRNKIPFVYPQMRIDKLVSESEEYDVVIYAYEEEAKTADYHTLSNVLNQVREGQSLLVCIGPEGGISPEEAKLLKKKGAYPVRLGPRILRTETAALYALASISYHFEEMGCQ